MKPSGCPYHSKNSYLIKDEYLELEGVIQEIFSDEYFLALMKKSLVYPKLSNFSEIRVMLINHILDFYKISYDKDSDVINFPLNSPIEKLCSGLNTSEHTITSFYMVAKTLKVPQKNIKRSIKKILYQFVGISTKGFHIIRKKLDHDRHKCRDANHFCLDSDGRVVLRESFDFDAYPGQCPALTASVMIEGQKTTPIKWMLDQMCGIDTVVTQEISKILE